ncbi:glycogen synthase GlgA [Halonatronum saccharophilum]|uniref:glycogen synthase GlgA n=1 Tax=Halonatronum saccharophilum TaxID=150060 RepID=UPI0004863D20|nr:glycogen synthase GlgA [Halonatronum saccharophilum]
MSKKMKILFVSSEVSPFAKTGGLADVAASLPKAIGGLGHDIRVVMPQYGLIDEKYRKSLEDVLHFRTNVAWRDNYVGVKKLEKDGIINYFIDNKSYFDRDNMYENYDRDVQFAYFCRAVLEMLPKLDFKPDIIHCNDWQTGPLSIMLEDNYKKYEFYEDIKTVFTIHNLRYQGTFSKEVIADTLGIDFKYWDLGVIRHNCLVNYMKMGIMNSDLITTVSKRYAQEIKTSEYGEGLDYAIRMNGDDVYGVLNGLDYEENNPSKDKRIYFNYNKEDLSGKYKNKNKLQKEMNLPQRRDIPLIGLVSRLVKQKGIDLIESIADQLLSKDIQLVVLGTGANEYEKFFKGLEEKYPNKVAANMKYDGDLAQKIYASSDMFLMPSQFEPCGLGQLISLRYGTVPIVRETGGLKDTIKAYDPKTGEGNGFTFINYDSKEMLDEINRAIKLYTKKKKWELLVKKIIGYDFSWENSAKEYIELYSNLVRG